MNFGILAASLFLLQKQVAGSGLLGLQLNVTAHGGVQELFDSAREERALGCKLIAFSIKWSDLEPTPGQFNLRKLKSEFDWRDQLGFVPYVTLQTIDTNRRTVPADLMNDPWDSPLMLQREKALLKAIASVLSKSTKGLMLGNEVDGYLSAHRNEVEPYLRFLDAGRNTLHTERPDILVGVTTMFLNLGTESTLISRLQSHEDLVSMTYYPLHGASLVRPPREVESDFAQMLQVSGSRPLFVQEAGFPASPIDDSSEELQSEFVGNVFDAMERHRDRLAGVCFFIAIDFSDALVNSLVGYYKVGDSTFRAFLSSLGLKKQDGTPRKAWATFKDRAKKYTAP